MAKLTITIERESEAEADTTLAELKDEFGVDYLSSQILSGRANEGEEWK